MHHKYNSTYNGCNNVSKLVLPKKQTNKAAMQNFFFPKESKYTTGHIKITGNLNVQRYPNCPLSDTTT